MALAFVTANGNKSTLDGTSVTTASFTPATGETVVMGIVSGISGSAPADPTVSNTQGVVYTKAAAGLLLNTGGVQYRGSIWTALGINQAGTVTFDWGAVSQGGFAWAWHQYTGVDTTTPIRQTKNATVGSGTAISATLDSALLSGSASLGLIWNTDTGTNAFTAGTGYTLGGQQVVATPGFRVALERNLTGSTTVNATYLNSDFAAIVGMELAAAGAAGAVYAAYYQQFYNKMLVA